MLLTQYRSSNFCVGGISLIYVADIDNVKMTNLLTCSVPFSVYLCVFLLYLRTHRIVIGRGTSVDVAWTLLVIVADKFGLQGRESSP